MPAAISLSLSFLSLVFVFFLHLDYFSRSIAPWNRQSVELERIDERGARTPPFLSSFSASVDGDPPPRKQYQLAAIFGRRRAPTTSSTPLMNALVRFINL